MFRRWVGSVVFALLATILSASTHAQSLPAPTGRTLEASDGDLVIVPSSARVIIVRRSQVQARLVYVAAQQTLLLMTDPAIGFGEGLPDAKGFRRWQVTDRWPLDPRWEGSATIDEYMPAARSPVGVAIHTDRGTIFVGHLNEREVGLTPPPVAVVRNASTSVRVAQGSFDEIEQAWLSGGDAALRGPGVSGQLRLSPPSSRAQPGPADRPVQPGAVRVGGNVPPPTKVHHVDPVYPPLALAARAQGVVILEVTVAEDGSVGDARVLRSIPLLDVAAVDAVRQWRFSPTLVNGVPTPVVMTVTVSFALPPAPQ